MEYRGEDVPATHGDWGRQTPWQPSSGAEPGSTGAWDTGPRGYAGDESYPPPDGGFGYPDSGYTGQSQQGHSPDSGYAGQAQHGYGPDSSYAGQGQQGYGPDSGYTGPDSGYTGQAQHGYGPDSGYAGQGQQGYGPQDGQFGDSYGQQSHEQYSGYGQGPGGAGGYGGPQGYPQGYPQHDDYGYDRGQNPSPGYDEAGYDQRSAAGNAPGGYQDPGGGYGQAPGYPAPSSGGGGYAAPLGGTGGYPALPSGQGGYSAEDAGNDWYGGQPAAANGASFADTGTYRLNGRVIDEYGTGPRGILRDPVRGYPPGPGQQGTGQLPMPANPAASGPQAFTRSGAQDIADTRQLGGYEDRPGYPDYGQDEPAGRPARGASGGFQGPGGRDGADPRGGYAAPDAYAAPGYGGYDGAPSPSADPGRDGYNDYEDGFDADGDPYQDRYGDGAVPGGTGGGGRSPRGRAAALGPLRGKRLLFAALAVVAVGIIGVAAYAFVFKPSSPASNPNVQGPLPTSGSQPSQQACVKQLGTYCHIEAATDDPIPLTTAELFPPAFTNEKDKTSYSLVSTKKDTTCGTAVIGSALVKALQAGKCTQVVRGSYVSGDNKIMGTIGVINLSSTNEAHYAGRVVGQNDFIAPLTSAKGVASKLGNGTGVVEAEFKGHYLILTWSEFVNGTNPSTKAEDSQLEQFSNDLVAGTANIDLSQRMVTGSPATPAASPSS